MLLGFIKKNYILFLIILLALTLRLLFLDRVPTGMTDDELHFILNAKAIAMTGHDLSGQWSPLSLQTIPTEFPTSELSFFVPAIFLKFLPLSLFTARMPYVFTGVASIILVYLIAKKLIGESEALIIAAVYACNPWAIYLSRTSFDAVVSLFFFLLAFYILVISKRWWLLLSVPALFLAFYSYLGSKLVFIPFVIISSVYSWYVLNKRKFTIQFLTILGLSFVILIFFIESLLHQQVGMRKSELFLPTNQSISSEVNRERQLSINTPLNKIFINKPAIYTKEFISKYISSFSTKMLFVDGGGYEPHLAFEYSGYFYYVDFIFFFFGFYALFKRKRSLGWLVISLLVIAQIPGMFHIDPEVSMIAHSILFFPFFMVFIGLGIYQLVKLLSNKKYKILIGIIISAIYLISLVDFYNSYFFRYPIYNSESFNFSNRLLSSYIAREQATQRAVIVIVPKIDDAESLFRNYIFYNNLYGPSTIGEVQKITRSKDYKIQNIQFVVYQKNLEFNKNETIILTPTIPPLKNFSLRPLTIPQLKDSGVQFSIYQGKTCQVQEHDHFVQNITFQDLTVEKLTNDEFCKKFIIQYQ